MFKELLTGFARGTRNRVREDGYVFKVPLRLKLPATGVLNIIGERARVKQVKGLKLLQENLLLYRWQLVVSYLCHYLVTVLVEREDGCAHRQPYQKRSRKFRCYHFP